MEAQIGDIYVSSWGYNMTNVSWYQVVRKTPKMVVLKELACKIVSGDAMSGESMPQKAVYTDKEPFKRELKNRGWGVKINSYEYARLWDGEPKHFNHWD